MFTSVSEKQQEKTKEINTPKKAVFLLFSDICPSSVQRVAEEFFLYVHSFIWKALLSISIVLRVYMTLKL